MPNLTRLRVLLPLGLAVAAVTASAQNLVVNGSFELPVLPANTPALYATGTDIGGWHVVGLGDVAVLNGSFTQAGLTFSHQDGVQSLDLTGLTNTSAGISQFLLTSPGTLYDLSFHVGNVQSTGPVWGTTSAVQVRVNGAPLTVASNSGGPTGSLGWQRFDFHFTAASASTELSFFNLDGPRDNVNQIDAVSVTSAVPEPATFALFALGLAWLGARQSAVRRRQISGKSTTSSILRR